jgi:hypothetical protein
MPGAYRQVQALGISFAKYCRERDLKVNQWYGIRTGLIRRDIAGMGEGEAGKRSDFHRCALRQRRPPPVGSATLLDR